MSIILYKPGTSYTSPKGIKCQFQICDPFSYEHLLKEGWFRTPEEVVEAETKTKVEAETKTKVEDKKAKVEDKKAKVEDKKAKVKTKIDEGDELNKAKIIRGLKAQKAKLLAKQDKE